MFTICKEATQVDLAPLFISLFITLTQVFDMKFLHKQNIEHSGEQRMQRSSFYYRTLEKLFSRCWHHQGCSFPGADAKSTPF